jgi:hypothetical protein
MTLRPLLLVALALALALVAPGVAAAAPTSATPPGPSGSNPPPEPNPEPSISGTGQVGGTLNGNRGTWQTGTQLSSEWIRCATASSGCETTGDTDLSYAVTAADAGKVIKLRVTGRRVVIVELGRRTVDAQTGPIAGTPGPPAAPANTSPPQILGSVREGQTLTASPGVWTGTAPINFAYSWTSCVQSTTDCIGRATGQTYRPIAADVGRRLVLIVSATNAVGFKQAAVIGPLVGKRAAALRNFRLMSPFPVLLIGGRVAGPVTTVTSMRIRRVPKGSIVNAACKGRGCPVRKLRTKAKKTGTVRLRRLQRRLRAGLTVVITVRQPDRLGKYVRLRIRRGQAPARVDRCVRPGSSKPLACP